MVEEKLRFERNFDKKWEFRCDFWGFGNIFFNNQAHARVHAHVHFSPHFCFSSCRHHTPPSEIYNFVQRSNKTNYWSLSKLNCKLITTFGKLLLESRKLLLLEIIDLINLLNYLECEHVMKPYEKRDGGESEKVEELHHHC